MEKKSTKELINVIESYVSPMYKFTQNPHENNRNPTVIESSSVLFFKRDSKKTQTKEQEINTIKIIRDLENLFPQIVNVEISKIQYEGQFLIITLDKYYNYLINDFNKYLDFKNLYAEKINRIYMGLEQKIPEEYIGWCMYRHHG